MTPLALVALVALGLVGAGAIGAGFNGSGVDSYFSSAAGAGLVVFVCDRLWKELR